MAPHHHRRSRHSSSSSSKKSSAARSIDLDFLTTPALAAPQPLQALERRYAMLEQLKKTMLDDRLSFDEEDISVLETALHSLDTNIARQRCLDAAASSPAQNGLVKIVDAMTAVLAKRQAVLESADEVMAAERDLLVFFTQKQAHLENQKNQAAERVRAAERR